MISRPGMEKGYTGDRRPSPLRMLLHKTRRNKPEHPCSNLFSSCGIARDHSLRPQVVVSGWQHKLSAHVLPMPHTAPASDSRSSVESLELGGEVRDGTARVLLALGGGVSDGAVGESIGLGGEVCDGTVRVLLALGGAVSDGAVGVSLELGGEVRDGTVGVLLALGGGVSDGAVGVSLELGGKVCDGTVRVLLALGGGVSDGAVGVSLELGGKVCDGNVRVLLAMGGGVSDGAVGKPIGLGGEVRDDTVHVLLALGGGVSDGAVGESIGLGGEVRDGTVRVLLALGGGVSDGAVGVSLGLGGEVSDGVVGIEVEKIVLVMLGFGSSVLGREVVDGTVVVASGETVSGASGCGVKMRVVEGAGAAVGAGRGDGARVPLYSSLVKRDVPVQLHSSYETEPVRSMIPFSAHSNWSTPGASYASFTHGSVPVSTMAATHRLTSYPEASDATRYH